MKSKLLPTAAAVLATTSSFIVVGLLHTSPSGLNPPPASRPTFRPDKAAPNRVIDLSVTYGIVNQTIFNKKTLVVFSTPQEFFSDSGVQSFDNLKFERHRRLPSDLRMVGGRRLTREEVARIEGRP